MAVVVGPLLSVDASGMIGDTLEFKCGGVACQKKRKSPGLENDEFNNQQKRFRLGTFVWMSLEVWQKQEWRNTGWWLEGKLTPHGQNVWIDGYQAFMSYFLRFGEYGWPGYPLPP